MDKKMTFLKKISALALLSLTTNTAWSEPVYFCKVERVYDDDVSVTAKIVHEDCSGVAFLWYAKSYVEASCWPGAIELLKGKCAQNDAGTKDLATDQPVTETQEDMSQPDINQTLDVQSPSFQ
ncbi:hypothetical protein A1332_15015 [Methylomonas methanica]|uniref:Secreted protein n=2 Tax=Methylomonas methanica TaxID=421 RepID=A0A177MG83_METMH|nr:hypothetical protein A1332_15015 [Methylomonas methanica]